jgi:hypothetical protein
MKKRSFFVTVVLYNAIWLSGAKGIHKVVTDPNMSGMEKTGLTSLIVLAVIAGYAIYRKIFWRYFD